MMTAGAENILKEFKLRSTRSRSEIIEVFLDTDRALSGADLEYALGDHVDRATVYRTINTFLDSGVIHKVLDDEGGTKYALCNHDCSQKDHNHDHVHFKCIKCGSIKCLDRVDIPSFRLPGNYTVLETNLLVTGICDLCNNR